MILLLTGKMCLT